MLMKNFLIFLLFYVYSVASLNNSFFNKQRAKIFELTDNEVAVFNVTLPDDEFILLKEKAKLENISNIDNSLEGLVNQAKDIIISILEIIQAIDFNEYYPNYDFDEILPELKIDDNGHSNINTEEILEGFDFNPEHYKDDFENNPNLIYIHVMKSNSKFDFYTNVKTLSNMKLSDEIDGMRKIIINMIFNLGYSDITLKKRDIIENSNIDNNNVSPEFKTKNAVLTVKINGENKNFKKVTFKIAGKYSRFYSKPGYNIKIRGGDDLYGRSHFKIRSDAVEPTFLRSKLVSDIHNRLGLPCVSSNYITLYINNEYMGLYILNDAYKPSWIEKEYGDKDTSTLYKCDGLFDFKPEFSSGCINDNDDINDDTEWIEFLNSVMNAKSSSDIENIFEIDHFITEMVIDYLLGSLDHLQNPIAGHNFYMYKQKNGKWIYLSYDFDLDIGATFSVTDIPYDELANMFGQKNLINLLILNEPSRFERILKDVVNKAINPGILYPHIDELKQLIKPYVELDKTPDSNGNYPGRLNTLAKDFYSLEDWDSNSEFTKYNQSYGIKEWILQKYRYVCNYYKIECDPIYMDENYHYNSTITSTMISPSTSEINISTQIEYESISTTTTIEIPTIISSPSSLPVENYKCWSELIGYECCSPEVTVVYAHDEFGDWSYDFNKNEWCGLTTYEERISDEDCWSEKYGYSCCKGCRVFEVDTDGSWGYEFNNWCGIPSYCNN